MSLMSKAALLFALTSSRKGKVRKFGFREGKLMTWLIDKCLNLLWIGRLLALCTFCQASHDTILKTLGHYGKSFPFNETPGTLKCL